MPGKHFKHDDNYYKSRKPKVDLGHYENLKKFIWDPEKRTILDRTSREWVHFGIFYCSFFGALFSLSYLQLYMTYKYVLSHDEPFIKIDKSHSDEFLEPVVKAMFRLSSLQLRGPGIALRPNVITKRKTPIIKLDDKDENISPYKYIEEVSKTLSEYDDFRNKFDKNCSDQVLREENVDKACYFDVKKLEKCSEPPFGYTLKDAQPCVYIIFNKRINWLPIFYSQASKLPSSMPEWLKKYIRDSDKFHVWLSCDGETTKDRNYIGEIEYLPAPGFPVQYFPFAGQKYYHAPMVALRFKNVTKNKEVRVVCTSWARNIQSTKRYNLDFKIFIASEE